MTRAMTLRLMCIKDLIRVCTSVYPPSLIVEARLEAILQMPALCAHVFLFIHTSILRSGCKSIKY